MLNAFETILWIRSESGNFVLTRIAISAQTDKTIGMGLVCLRSGIKVNIFEIEKFHVKISDRRITFNAAPILCGNEQTVYSTNARRSIVGNVAQENTNEKI